MGRGIKIIFPKIIFTLNGLNIKPHKHIAFEILYTVSIYVGIMLHYVFSVWKIKVKNKFLVYLKSFCKNWNCTLNDCLPMLAQFLHQLAVDLKLNYYIHHYWSDFPSKCPLSPSVVSFHIINTIKIMYLN